MKLTYILPKARNVRTGQTVKSQDLTGRRYQPHEQLECRLLADRLAAQMTTVSGETWVAVVETYQVS
jgi:hypothetical protein